MMDIILTLFIKYRTNTSGATAIEYGLILALVFVAILGGVTAFSDANNNTYNSIAEKMT